MKKLIWPAFFVALSMLAGCACENTKPEPVAAEQPAPAPAPAPAATPAPQPPAANPLLSQRSVYYDFDSAVLKDEYKKIVTAHAENLAAHPSLQVEIQGNCDERGSREYNLALGQRRADGVKKMMLLLGAKDGQITTVSFGKEKPRAMGHNEEAWQQNRRSDIVYQGE